jgi:hypothetical protein
MIRLRRDDFNDPHELAKFAATAGLSLQDFRKEFEYLVNDEPPPVVFDPELGFIEHSDEQHDPASPRPPKVAEHEAEKPA